MSENTADKWWDGRHKVDSDVREIIIKSRVFMADLKDSNARSYIEKIASQFPAGRLAMAYEAFGDVCGKPFYETFVGHICNISLKNGYPRIHLRLVAQAQPYNNRRECDTIEFDASNVRLILPQELDLLNESLTPGI